MNALQHLSKLANQRKAERHPNFPQKYIPRSSYTDKDANSLTKCIVDFLTFSGHFATRLSSTGTFRNDIGKYIPSQQRAGLPDIMAVVTGKALFIEVKAGKDRISSVQRETIDALLSAGSYVYIAHSFQEFYDWFTSQATFSTQA